MDAKSNLLEVVAAAHATGSLAGCLDRRQQQTYQHADDGDNNQQFDEGESTTPLPACEFQHDFSFVIEKKNRELLLLGVFGCGIRFRMSGV